MSVASTEFVAWGWIERNGTPQTTFVTAGDAVDEMRDRLGQPEYSVEDIERIGFRLGRVRVTVEPISTLRGI